MKFLLECVGCCMMSAASSGDASMAEPSSPASETRLLVSSVPETTRLGRRRKRTSSRTASADWRPSLFAISEDNTIPVGPEKKQEKPNQPAQVAAKPASSRNVKRSCATSSVRVNGHPRPHEFGHNPLPMVVPAFTAAPFMF